VAEVPGANQLLSNAEAAPFCERLGAPEEKRPVWKHWLNGTS
jgi:hypothetical protein